MLPLILLAINIVLIAVLVRFRVRWWIILLSVVLVFVIGLSFFRSSPN